MKYWKVIKSGSIVEYYSFEKLPLRFQKTVKRQNLGYHCRRKDNVINMKKKFTRLVWNALKHNKKKPLFITFTTKQRYYDVSEIYKAFKLASKRLKYQFPNMEYIIVPDFHKDMSLHMHALVWGIPEIQVSEHLYIAEKRKALAKLGMKTEQTSLIEDIYQLGFIDIVQTDGSNKLGTYMGKYMLKYCAIQQTYYKKAFSRSRNVCDSPVQFWLHDVIPNATPNTSGHLWTVSYDTKYLGRGEYYILDLET